MVMERQRRQRTMNASAGAAKEHDYVHEDQTRDLAGMSLAVQLGSQHVGVPISGQTKQ